jgi:hypothetical protein
MNFRLTRFSPASCHVLTLRSKASPFFIYPQAVLFFNLKRQVLHPQKKNKIILRNN